MGPLWDAPTMVDAGTQWVVAALTGGVAAVVLAANVRRSWNQWLAFFLALIAANFAFTGAAKLLLLWQADGFVEPAAAASLGATLRSLAALCGAFDPAVLAYFAAIFPRRTRLAGSPWGLALLGVPVLALAGLEVAFRSLSAPSGPFDATKMAHAAFLAACYLYATWRIGASFLHEPSSVMARQLRMVWLGVAAAAVPRVALIPVGLTFSIEDPTHYLGQLAIQLSVLWGILVLGWRWISAVPLNPQRRADARSLVRLVAVVFAVFSAMWSTDLLLRAAVVSGAPVSAGLAELPTHARHGVYAVRWGVFSAAMVAGVASYQILAVDPRSLLPAGALVGGVVAFFAVAVGAAALGPWGAGALAAATVALVAAAAAGPWSRPARDSAGYLHERRLQVYQALLAASLAEGRDPSRRPDLESERARLGITREEHDALLAIAAAEEAHAPRSPDVLGRFQVLRRLGVGGLAAVYLAKDRADDRLVVLKWVRADWASPAGALAAARREVEVAKRVSHPRLVAVHDAVPVGDGALVVMEYVGGGSLADLMARDGPLSADRAAGLIRQILEGLAALHDAGLVHGDLKPGNVLLTTEGDAKLADFGSARPAAPGRTVGSGPSAGRTVEYAPPEARLEDGARPGDDLYAVGLIAHEMLAGHLPSDGGASAAARFPRTPAGWQPFLERALASRPEDRHLSAAEMLRHLDRITGSGEARAAASRRMWTLEEVVSRDRARSSPDRR